MEKIVEQGILYDFYGELLTEHQRRLYEDAVYNDLSLREIADENGISRQGVHNLLRRCDKILEGYEDKLHLLARFLKNKEQIIKIRTLTQNYQEQNGAQVMAEIEAISNQILEEL